MNKIQILYLVVFIAHQIAENIGLNHWFIDSYLDDFLFLPLFLFTVEFIFSSITQHKITLTLSHKISLIVFILIVVEIVFPLRSHRFVFDYWDFFTYGLGYIFYIGILKFFNNDKVKIT